MRASIRQVAERAGVSRTTVSNLLLGRNGRASRETRERVMLAAAELNYIPVPQPVTQTRRTATRVIGLVFGGVTIRDNWGMQIYQGLCDGAMEHGYDLLTLLRTGPEWMIDQQELRFLDRRSDGFIFVVPRNHYKAMETLVQHDIPVAACALHDVPPGVPAVGTDDDGCMAKAVAHLARLGHRRIAHFGGSGEETHCRNRCRAYGEAMAAHGLEPLVVPETGSAWPDQMMEAVSRQGATGIVAVSDAHALIAWRLLESRGLQVPRDVSIVGMDDIPEAAHAGLTTFRYSSEDVGRMAMNIIAQMIAGDRYAPNQTLVPVELVERTSVAMPRTAKSGA